MKRLRTICAAVCAALLCWQGTAAQMLPPYFTGNNNAGTEFYLTFLPAYPEVGDKNDIRIYISSAVETDVVVEVKALDLVRRARTIPNDIVEIVLSPMEAQPYHREFGTPPPPDKIYRQHAVHITADDPIIVYGMTRFQYTSDGFLALPVSALGREYIIASMGDDFDNKTLYLPSETGIVAAYDNTKVLFTLGGNLVTKTAGGMQPGQTKTFVLNRGDVLSIASLGQMADLSGSKVVADKPIAVVSGNYCANVPQGIPWCDHIVEMELPTHTWGKAYHVTKLAGRLKNSFIRIFAKEPNTKIFKDGHQIGVIRDAGGLVGTGFLHLRVDDGAPGDFIISADKPISITQYNPGQSDDNVPSDPFQLVLTPLEQFQTEIVFNTPGIGDGKGFATNYINLVFELDEQGNMPQGLEFARVTNGTFTWRTVAELYGASFDSFAFDIDGKAFGMKTIALPGDGVYRLRSPKKIAAYAYGFANYDSYGYPAGAMLADNSGGVDTLSPTPTYTINDSNGRVSDGLVVDEGEWRSNLARVEMIDAFSENYTFVHKAFIPGEDGQTQWELAVGNPQKPAKAVLLFVDRAGNDTTVTLTYAGDVTAGVAVQGTDLGGRTVGHERQRTLMVRNDGTTAITITAVDVSNSAVFELLQPLVLPIVVEAGEEATIDVLFKPRDVGVVIGDVTLHFGNQAKTVTVQGVGLAPALNVPALTFAQTKAEQFTELPLVITNNDAEEVRITDVLPPESEEFTVVVPDLPIVIAPGAGFSLPVRFQPTSVRAFDDEIIFKILDYEVRASLQGEGVLTVDVEESVVGLTAEPAVVDVHPNPVRDEMTISYELPSSMHARVALYDALGVEVLVVYDGVQQAGRTTLRIGVDGLASGVYHCRVTAGDLVLSGRVVVAR